MSEIYIGLMSGTSVDSIDGVIVDLSNKIKLITTHSLPIPQEIKEQLLSLNDNPTLSLPALGELDMVLGHLFSDCVNLLLTKSNLKASDVKAIGCHGQTIWHQPTGNYPFSMQIGNAALIAKKTKIATVSDFRNCDIALGGQGAPLAPAFHKYLFDDGKTNRAIVNIGGIANITVLPKGIGYDIGPGNSLLDAWCQKHQNKPFDDNGQWAKSGAVSRDLLTEMISDDYFSKPYPKSTGKDYFNINWVQNFKTSLKPSDIQATLTYLTASSISNAVKSHFESGEVYLCGGGAFNEHLFTLIEENLGIKYSLSKTENLYLDSQWVEAACFAWLAKQRLELIKIDTRQFTGSKKPTVLGCVHHN